MFGDENGPVGSAFANGMTTQSDGHTGLLAVIAPNLVCLPHTVLVNKVTIAGMRQAVQHFGPAQAGVARAVSDFFDEKRKANADIDITTLKVVVGVFIHPGAGLDSDGKALEVDAKAASDKKIYDNNYAAVTTSLENAWSSGPTPDEVSKQKATAVHPFQGFEPEKSDAA
ncbi:UNVERIFIED_CONTAM: hypothetical protein GTU68_017470 [Idotea baltica]|nr:hypothetical protein [Idotea baltica]